MNTENYTKWLGTIVLILGIFGLALGDVRLGEVLNTDMALDITRITLGIVLIVSTLISRTAIQKALSLFSLVYISVFFATIISPDLFGILPSGIGFMDHILHLGGGMLALALAFRSPQMIQESHA